MITLANTQASLEGKQYVLKVIKDKNAAMVYYALLTATGVNFKLRPYAGGYGFYLDILLNGIQLDLFKKR